MLTTQLAIAIVSNVNLACFYLEHKWTHLKVGVQLIDMPN